MKSKFIARAISRDEMRQLVGREIRARLDRGAEAVTASFPFLRDVLGDWGASREECQARLNDFAGEFGFAGNWDWDGGTHVTFSSAPAF
jgi:hypothetical protein